MVSSFRGIVKITAYILPDKRCRGWQFLLLSYGRDSEILVQLRVQYVADTEQAEKGLIGLLSLQTNMGEEDVPTHLCLSADLSLWVTIPILSNFSSICVQGEIIWCSLGSLLDLSFRNSRG